MLVGVLLCSEAASADETIEPYRDSTLTAEQRADDLLPRLTVDEKIALMQSDSAAIPRLRIPAYNWWNEALHGVARAGTATVFPQAIGLAATFDRDLVGQIGHAVAEEGRVKYEGARPGTQYAGLTYFTPVVNIARDPRWGRTQETFGEDPLLTSELAGEFVRGLQGPDPDHPEALATLKHFAVHSGPERGRLTFDAAVSAFDLGDTYVAQFERVVRTTAVGSVMTSYNEINGVPASLDAALLDGSLRQDWGFGGYVVSDCDAVKTAALQSSKKMSEVQVVASAVLAGVDLNCGSEYHLLARAVASRLLDVADIDRSVRRLLVARFRLGTIGEDAGPYARISPAVLDSPAHRDLARRAALESIVLLRNRRGILPLDPSRVKRLAIVGSLARDRDALIGDYAGKPSTLLTIEKALKARAGPSGVQVRYYAPDHGAYSPAATEQIAKRNDAVVAVLGLSSLQEGEEGNGGDRDAIELPNEQARLLAALSRSKRPVIVVLTGGSAFALKNDAGAADAILDAWYAGEEGGPAVAAVLFGDANPAGRLPLTFYARTADLPQFKNYTMSGRTYRYFRGEPPFRFGDGLSYTRFAYRDAVVQIDDEVGPVASVTVENLGPRDGDEVVQIYVNPPAERSARIENRQLAAFARLSIPRGAERRLTIPLGWWAVSTVDAAGKRAVRAGTFHFSIGGGQPGPGTPTAAADLDLPAPYDGRELRDADYALCQAAVTEP